MRRELQSNRIHAIAEARGGSEPVRENVSEVSVARRTPNFGSRLSDRVVLEKDDRLGVDGLVERGPSAVAVEFRAGDKQFRTASAARIQTSPVLFEQFARPRALGASLAQHVELFGGQSLAPLGVGPLARVFRHAHH